MKRLLIIDNEPQVLEVMKEVFTYEGYDVHAVLGTENISKIVADERPDLLLIDFSLDGLNGGEICAQLKRDVQHMELPVIIISAYANKGLAAGSYGCDDFINKPFDLYDLISRIHTSISQRLQINNHL